MAEFLTTHATAFQIENIIIEAKRKLVLVSPYLQISTTFYERLKEASEKGVEIQIIYREVNLNPNEKRQLECLKNISLFCSSNLHAKCYYNEDNMVITSMNMYEFSEKHNREMGVLINRKDDQKIYEKAYTEAESILHNSTQQYKSAIKKETKRYESSSNSVGEQFLSYGINKIQQYMKSKQPKYGYCIRCNTQILYNPNKPYCEDCFKTWASWGDWDFVDKVCHRCGKETKATMRKPLCKQCR